MEHAMDRSLTGKVALVAGASRAVAALTALAQPQKASAFLNGMRSMSVPLIV